MGWKLGIPAGGGIAFRWGFYMRPMGFGKAGGAFGGRGYFIWADKIIIGNRPNNIKIILSVMNYILIRSF